MKVKVIVIPVLITRVEPDAVEEQLQAWLNDNPNASIQRVAQPLLRASTGRLDVCW
jgi:hypothetical protein